MHNVFIFVNLHLNDFCVISRCFIGHLVNNKYWIVGSWSMLKILLYLIFCEIESFILRIYKWPYIDEYEDIKLKRTWIYVLIWLFIMVFYEFSYMILSGKITSFEKLHKKQNVFFWVKKPKVSFFMKIGCDMYGYLHIWWICFVTF